MNAVALFLLAACSGGSEAQGTQDVKVDQVSPDDAVESDVPRACADGGAAYVAWHDDRGGDSAVYVNFSVDGGSTWREGDEKLNTAAAAASHPAIACSGDEVWVVWEDERDGELRNRNIRMNRSSDRGRSWLEEDVLLDGDVEGDAMSLAPAIVAVEEDVYVAWFDSREGAYDIYVQASTDGGETWLAEPTRVDTDEAGAAYSAYPSMVADADGRVVVAWEDSRDGASDVYVNVSSDNAASFAAGDTRLDVGSDGTNSFLPRLAMSGDRVYAVWHDERNGARDVLLSASADGGETWSEEPVRLEDDAPGQSDSYSPRVAAVGDRVHVVWQDDRSGGYDVFHRASMDGGATFGEELRMDADTPGEAQSYSPVLTVVGDTVLVGWEDRRNDPGVGFNDLYYRHSLDGGREWSAEDLRINSNEPGSAYAVELQLLVTGPSFVAVWADGRFGSRDIFAAVREIGEESVYVAPAEEESR
jgi:hypothetical protein